jgi:hypothetical protein
MVWEVAAEEEGCGCMAERPEGGARARRALGVEAAAVFSIGGGIRLGRRI